MSEIERVGVVGLGRMGGAFARNLLASGFTVVGFDVDDEAVARFVTAGGVAAGGAGEVARETPVVVLSLPSVAALGAVVEDLGASGADGTVVVEAGTLPIDEKIRARDLLAARGLTLLDCPVSGTGAQAAAGDLVVLASGDEAAVDRCHPVFDGFTRVTHYLGEFGNGMKMKFVANVLVGIHNASAAEALVLARKAGLDARQAYEVLSAGAGSSRMLEVRGPMMVDRVYEPATAQNSVWQKDVALITEFARGLDCPLPLFAAAEPLYVSARAHVGDDQDTASVNVVYELLAGLGDDG